MLPALSGMLPDSLLSVSSQRRVGQPSNIYGATGKMPVAAGKMPALPH